MNTYKLELLDMTRELPRIKIDTNLEIASFVILGDTELIEKSAKVLSDNIPDNIDYIICPEAKSIPLAHSVAVRKGIDYIVLRKSIKGYMESPIIGEVKSITTTENQILVLDGKDANKLNNKKVAIVDDVISTGGSMKATEKLLEKVNSYIEWKGVILSEGEDIFEDVFYIEKLPLFMV